MNGADFAAELNHCLFNKSQPAAASFPFSCFFLCDVMPCDVMWALLQDAGIAMLEAFSANIYNNMIDGVRYGIRMSLGSANNMVFENTFNDCTDCEFGSVGSFGGWGARDG